MRNTEGSAQSPGVTAREAPGAGSTTAPLGLRELFEVHGAYVWKTFRRLGVRAADLDDLTHDLFLVVHRHIADYDRQRPVRPWLFGFAYRMASDYRRRAHRRYEVDGDGVGDPVDTAARPDERLATEQDRVLVQRALESVELGRRAVFVLYDIDGEPMSEIACSLGIPAGTAYSRLRLAREEFAAAVKRLRLREGRR